MKRKLMALAFVGVLAAALGAVIVGTTLAQPGRFVHIYAKAEGDDTVVVRVSGLPITQGVVRRSSEGRRSSNAALSRDEADQQAIVPLVGRKAVVAEAIRRGLEPTEEETEAYIERHKRDCDAAGSVCHNAIINMGFSYLAFWSTASADYKEALTITRLHLDNYEKSNIGPSATEEEVWAAREAMNARALKAATIVWEDQRLQRLYEEATAN